MKMEVISLFFLKAQFTFLKTFFWDQIIISFLSAWNADAHARTQAVFKHSKEEEEEIITETKKEKS